MARKPRAREPSGDGTAVHLRSVELKEAPSPLPDRFPFSLRAVRGLDRVQFPTPVTFFVGENGSGESTLLEAMATNIRGFFPRAEDFFGFAKSIEQLEAEIEGEYEGRSEMAKGLALGPLYASLAGLSQLGLIAMLKEMIQQESQFLIATHSSILLAFPNATIYSFDESPIAAVPFDQLDHVTLTRDFLNNLTPF